MKQNSGMFMEDEFIRSLNDKRFGDLSNNLKHMLRDMFDVLFETNVIHAGKIMGYLKPDIFIECRGKVHFLSLKTGRATTIHQEQIKSFILFLREKGISKETQKTILLYQYGDGTMDGTGSKRDSFEELNYKLKDRIIEANKELNANIDFVVEFVDRAVFVGTIDPSSPAEFIYHGNLEYGTICSRKQISNYVRRKDKSFLHCLHIGPLLIRPHARYVNKEVTNEERRHKVDFQWVNLIEDLEYISRRYNG